MDARKRHIAIGIRIGMTRQVAPLRIAGVHADLPVRSSWPRSLQAANRCYCIRVFVRANARSKLKA
jgi:hypothetical protein